MINNRPPIIILIKERGFINQRSGLTPESILNPSKKPNQQITKPENVVSSFAKILVSQIRDQGPVLRFPT